MRAHKTVTTQETDLAADNIQTGRTIQLIAMRTVPPHPQNSKTCSFLSLEQRNYSRLDYVFSLPQQSKEW
jgi:hypothetical protein